jgi:hypothetical protein
MAKIAGKNGNVYTTSLSVEDCEDTWSEQVVSGVALSTTTGKVGTYAARATTTSIGADTILMSEAISADLSTYDALILWIRSSVNTAAGDLRILLDDTANCASPLENLQVPALVANTWTRVLLRFATPANLTAVISIGLKQQVGLADGTFDIDDVHALKQIAGIDTWSIDYTANTEETTDFSDAGVEAHIPTTTGWSGSFDGKKDGAPLGFGSEVKLALGESSTNGQCWIGNAIVTGISPNTSAKGLVLYKYTYLGTGELQTALL